MQLLARIYRMGLATLVKFFMIVVGLAGVFGIPYFLIVKGWSLLIWLYYGHIVWFGLLAVPVILLVLFAWRLFYRLLGGLLSFLGSVVDTFER